jgi:hypothetical protein
MGTEFCLLPAIFYQIGLAESNEDCGHMLDEPDTVGTAIKDVPDRMHLRCYNRQLPCACPAGHNRSERPAWRW